MTPEVTPENLQKGGLQSVPSYCLAEECGALPIQFVFADTGVLLRSMATGCQICTNLPMLASRASALLQTHGPAFEFAGCRFPYTRCAGYQKTPVRFKPKNKEEREEVSVSASLIAALKKYKASQKTEYRRARVSQRIRRTRQATRVQDQAGSEGPYCSNFFFHKFRHTFATRNLQDHVCEYQNACRIGWDTKTWLPRWFTYRRYGTKM